MSEVTRETESSEPDPYEICEAWFTVNHDDGYSTDIYCTKPEGHQDAHKGDFWWPR